LVLRKFPGLAGICRECYITVACFPSESDDKPYASINSWPDTKMEPSSGSPETSADITSWVTDYGDDLYRYALLQLRDHHAAEEVVQETFVGAIKSHGNFSGRSTVRAWLLSILRHKIVDFIRTRARYTREHGVPDSDNAKGFAFDEHGNWRAEAIDWHVPDQIVEDRELWVVLHKCLGNLPTGQADTFVLSVMHELGSDEVCEQLDITPSNLWVRLHRARLALAICMGVNWFGDPEEDNDGSE
jgi:RNA polymerase sigma-70 factor (TIGR02943 family)